MTLIIKYRPGSWTDFVGNEEIVGSVRSALDEEKSHSFLFSGASGFGKTTLARICARHLGTSESNIIEIDGASSSGAEAMREILEGLRYRPLGKGTNKVVIVDECHAISAQAWKTLYKPIEEPPPWVHWFLCTTDIGRVPEPIRTRCAFYTLKGLSNSQLTGLLDRVVAKEGVKVDVKILDLCVKEAAGSARRALANLAQAMYCATREEAAATLGAFVEEEKPYHLAQALLRKQGWPQIYKILEELREENPETIRHIVRASVTSAIFKARDEKEVVELLPLLDEFLQPLNTSDGISPIISACARWVFR